MMLWLDLRSTSTDTYLLSNVTHLAMTQTWVDLHGFHMGLIRKQPRIFLQSKI